MSDLNIYACGGFGLNIMSQFKTSEAKTEVGMDANVYGIDFSSNNIPKTNCFEVVNGEGGSGKVRAINAEGSREFVNSFMANHKPNKFNIVVFSAAGGSGSLLGPEIVRYLLERGLPVISVILDDYASDIEEANCTKTYMTLDNYRKRSQRPLVFHDICNNSKDPRQSPRTRKEVDKEVCDVLNLLTIMLDDTHGELDYNDISNFLNFSQAVNANPVMTKILLLDQDTAKDLQEQIQENNNSFPVASLSIFKDAGSICNCWTGVQYRATGVFHDMELPTNMKEFHAVLDYGATVKEIQDKIQKYKDREADTKMNLNKNLDIGDGSDEPIL